ncbi:MAG: DUF1501 domain-containing protein [Puia sp.]|nr:DUF1501 domain-containing protein [Puia sp.]
MKRRDFLRYTIPTVMIPSLVNGLSLKAIGSLPAMDAWVAGMDVDHVLVLVQLNGGNDGLNTVIPLEFYESYRAARTNIAIPENRVLPLRGHGETGIHPAMTGLQQLFNDEKLAIVQAVGYPRPDFSHFRATDIWLTGADPNQVLPTGWAGRYLNAQYPHFPEDYPNSRMPDPLAIQVGSIVSPALQGPALTMGMAISNPDSFYKLIDGDGTNGATATTRAGEQIAYIREMAVKTDQYAGVIKKAAQRVICQSEKYPSPGKNPLADQLKIVARLIAGGLKTKIYVTNLGGFDTHARQTEANDTTTGNHAKLLARLSEAIGIFMEDLQGLDAGDRVIGMTFSEFGRRIKSNASGGTDHGAAAPVFLFGNRVRPGVIGQNPALPVNASVNDNIGMQYDFRSLYAGILQNWFQVPGSEADSLLMKGYPALPLIRG